MSLQNEVHGVRRNRILSTLMDDHHSSVNVGQDFKLKCGREFEDRAQSVFSGLAEAGLGNQTASSADELLEDSPPVSDDESDSSKFVKPIARAPKRRLLDRRGLAPDFVNSPKKWKKYSLSDVPDHSDQDNCKAAADFLANIRKSKSGNDSKDHDSGKIRFAKPGQTVNSEGGNASTSDSSTTTFSRSVHVMPECVIGKKTSAPQKVDVVRKEKRKEICLSHLDEND